MIKKIAPDKWKHFFVGVLMGIVIETALWHLFPAHLLTVAITTFVLVVAISYGFEVISLLTGKGHYDVMDAVAGTIGGIAGMSIMIGIQPLLAS